MSATVDEGNSDYGSDLDEKDEHQLRHLLDAIEVSNAELLLISKPEGDERPAAARIPTGSQCSQIQPPKLPPLDGAAAGAARLDSVPQIEIAYEDSPGQLRFESSVSEQHDRPDTRSPLERFRTAPKKPLSVTDLISPAWCELQYWYSLTKYGRVKRTAAMKRGSEVHKELEEQVHTMVPVEVQTKEDRWGLRIWNVIQGLRTLRTTGMTRELEVWGLLEGKEVVNGVIDELSFTCTDQELEERIERVDRGKGKSHETTPSDQTTLAQFFRSQGGGPLEERVGALEQRVGRLENASGTAEKSPQQAHRKIYMTDVKTRASNTLPNANSMRPTHMQLMLYRKLLADMSTNSVNSDAIFQRYGVDATRPFSDSLIAQLSGLEFSFSSQLGDSEDVLLESDDDAVTELLQHNSLTQMWSLMMAEFQNTMPKGAENISKVLKTEFRSSRDGAIVGVKTFPYLDDQIDGHIAEEMRWWRGEREAKGVDIEEAFKCRICEFAEGCSWRINKIQDAVKASRVKYVSRKGPQMVE